MPDTQRQKVNTQKRNEIKIISDTLHHNGSITVKESTKSWFEFIFPSIIALTLGVISFISTWLAMKNSRNMIRDQIAVAKETAEMEFRQNVHSKNRIEWMEELREKVSELLGIITYTATHWNIAKDNMSDYLERVYKLANHISLMSYNNELHEQLMININQFVVIARSTIGKNDKEKAYAKRKEILNITKQILKYEWERVKKGE